MVELLITWCLILKLLQVCQNRFAWKSLESMKNLNWVEKRVFELFPFYLLNVTDLVFFVEIQRSKCSKINLFLDCQIKEFVECYVINIKSSAMGSE